MNSQIKQRIDQIRRGEVPEGYKKTKVGIVPEEWEITKLYLISSHVSKKNTNGEVQTTFTNSATQGVIKQTDYFDKEISNKENITSYYVVQENDYIYNPRISVSAPCGPINKSHFSENGIVSPLYTVFRLNDVFQQNKYIEFFFKSSFWHSYMCGIANYGARHDRMNITNYDLFNMPIPFPPIAEQEKIAAILQTEDKVIELQQKKIDELKRLKKVYLSKMFPKKDCNVPEIRFPGFTEPWEQRKVSDVAEICTGGTPSTGIEKYWYPKEIPWLSSGEVHKKYITYTDNKISVEGMNNSSARMIPENSVLIALAGQGKTRGTVAINRIPLTTNQSIAAMAFSNEVVPEFVFCNLESRYEEIRRMSSGDGSRGGLNKQIIGEMEIPYTSKEEQTKIGAYFFNLDNLITLHQRKCDEEKQKKKALMQLLLTGIVRTNK